jgi:tRNA dimethylallyltransferase
MFLLVRATEDLGRRIASRCRAMVEAGLELEIRRLLDEGVPKSSAAFESLGYREWLEVTLGKKAEGEAMELFVRRTRQYARRQLTWFRNRYRGFHTVMWDPGETRQDIIGRILTQLPRNWGLPRDTPAVESEGE